MIKENTTEEVKVQTQTNPTKMKSIIEEKEAHLEIKTQKDIIVGIGILIDKDTLKGEITVLMDSNFHSHFLKQKIVTLPKQIK